MALHSLASGYIRPELVKLDEDIMSAEERLSRPYVKKLRPNMWVLGQSRGYVRGTFIRTIVIKNKEGYFRFPVVVNKKGLIPDRIVAERLMDVEYGDRQGKIRNVFIDINNKADKVCTTEDLAGTYEWWLHPNESDIKGIDDPSTKLFTLLSGAKGKKPVRAVIIGGTEKQRDNIATHLRNSFTIREKRIIDNCIISIGNPGKGCAGYFMIATTLDGRTKGVPQIVIGKDYTKTAETVVHEAVHALRAFDDKRDPKLKRTRGKLSAGRDVDLEESMTEAETVAREKPFTKQHATAGYYHYIKVPDKTSRDMIVVDRVVVTDKLHDDPKGGLKGKRMEKQLVLKYPSMYISKLKMKGNAEAIDSYYQINNMNGDGLPGTGHIYIQAFSPKANDKGIKKQIKDLPATSLEFHDGKPTVLKKYRKPKKNKSQRANNPMAQIVN